ncbi:MAG: hypothetical protein WC713_04015 [Candidatus Methylomirabilota bacterium]
MPTNREAQNWMKVQEDAARRKMQRERQAAVVPFLRVAESKKPQQMRVA